MKDMSVEELIVKCGVGWNDFKAELLRRFEVLKCCGNCKLGYTLECPMWKVYKEKGDDYPSECGYCDRWQPDGLSREEREGK